MTTKNEPRVIEKKIVIDAPAEEVWKALTDPDELTNWFCLDSEVTPGVGGSITLAWAPDMRGEHEIFAWHPGRHLQTGWFEPVGEGKRVPLVVDYFLEGEGGKTVLRLVHSGFGPGADWDEEYDGINRGWHYELRSLKHYLERKKGRQRRSAWARVPVTIPFGEAWARILGPEGLVASGGIEKTGEGDRYAFTTPDGERFEGTVLVHKKPTDFVGIVENQDDALLRLGLEAWAGRREVFLWFHSWNAAPEDIAERQRRWTDHLTALLAK